jgi:hypothetical protein
MLLVLTLGISGCLNEALIKQPELFVIPGLPVGWSGTDSSLGVGTTATDRYQGSTAAYLSTAFQSGNSTIFLRQEVKADDYRGKRVRLSAWVKPRNISAVSNSGIWMRVDGPGVTLAYDDMTRRPVYGYGNWRQISVVLDVPENAIGIALGALFFASNTLLVDDMRFEVVGTDVASTNTLSVPATVTRDSASTVAAYAQRGNVPVNLDFEAPRPSASVAR